MSALRLSSLCAKIAVVLMALLPFLVLFDSFRNVDLQGGLILVAGGFAWLSGLLSQRLPYDRLTLGLIATFAGFCLLSTAVHAHVGYDLFGAPYIRLGALGLISCIGCGLVVARCKPSLLVERLYQIILALAVISIPYSLITFHSLHRLPGLVSQADLMATFLGCGLLLGLHLLQIKWRRWVLASQLLLTFLLILTETRAVIALVLLLVLVWQYREQRMVLRRWWPAYVLGLVIVLAGLQAVTPNRLTSSRYASQSISYRLDLQQQGVKASWQRPVLGYGPGNLADALDCRNSTAPALLKSCRQHYFFNSSHNIFLDRVLALGWLGGLSYVAIVGLALWRGWRAQPAIRSLTYVALLITLYYCTNVTSVTLELLFWILLLQIYRHARHEAR